MKIIKIGAIWCPACLIMTPRWNKLKIKYNLDITEYDYDIDEDIIKEYNIGKILPVVIIFDKNNQELERLIGEISENKLESIIEKYN